MTSTETHKVFNGWQEAAARDPTIYPGDAPYLDGFKFDLIAGPYMGPLLFAPIVVLTTNGGYDGARVGGNWFERDPAGHVRHLSGQANLPLFGNDEGARRFTLKIPKRFGFTSIRQFRSDFAFVNIFPYKTPEKADIERRLMRLLPSVRDMRAWADQTLFQDARARKRVVIVARSHSDWGLLPKAKPDGWLFTDVSNPRGASLLRDEKVFRPLYEAVQEALAFPHPPAFDIPF